MKVSFRTKITLTIIVVSMAITIALSMMFYSQSAQTVQENYSTTQVSSLQSCAQTFDDIMTQVYYACMYAADDAAVKDALLQQDGEALYELLEEYSRLNTDIDVVGCYLPQRNVLIQCSTGGISIMEATEEIQNMMTDILPQQHTNQLSPIYVEDMTAITKNNLFVYSRQVTQPDGTVLAQILSAVDERTMFFKCLQNGTMRENCSGYIVNGDNIVSAANIYDINEKLTLPEENAIITDVAMPMSDYHIVSVVDNTAIMGEMTRIRNKILLAAVLLNLGFGALILLVVQQMMLPMERLRDNMQEASEGNLKVRAKVYHEDEIGQLSQGFNNMISQIEGLIEELVTERMLKREAEIEALQYQITPHFMYNTLNSIKYQAILQGSKDTGELLEAFIELLQLSASDRGAFIPVEQEMHMVENYVKLQKFRYADCFDAVFDIQDEAKQCYVPRLLVQPLVENAILHGIDHRKQNNKILISAMCDEDSLSIKIQDQGRGMTPQEIQQLMEGKRKSKFSGIGVSNIRERLRLYYGSKGTLQFFSDKEYGTRAVVTMPISHDPNEYTI